MSNALYDKGRQAFLNGDIDWTDDDIKLTLVRSADYVVNLATDEYYDDIPVVSRAATSSNFVSKTSVAGVADAADVVLASVPAGNACDAIIIWKDTGTESTSRLIAYIDTLTGLPVTPNGSDITIVWSSGANKIFKL